MLHNVLAAANLPPVSTAYNVDEMSNTYALIKEPAIPKSMRFLINAYVFDISSTLYTVETGGKFAAARTLCSFQLLSSLCCIVTYIVRH